MSYISFWKHISYDTPGLRSEGYPCGPPTLKTKVGRVPLPKLGMTLIRVPTVWEVHNLSLVEDVSENIGEDVGDNFGEDVSGNIGEDL